MTENTEADLAPVLNATAFNSLRYSLDPNCNKGLELKPTTKTRNDRHATAFTQQDPIMEQIPVDPTPRYQSIATRFRPIFQEIARTSSQRELNHQLPYEEVTALCEAGFSRLRLPVDYGGVDASIPELCALLIELGAADSNFPNIFRSHFGFCEEVLSSEDCQWKSSWLTKLAAGGIAGSGFAEIDNNKVGSHTTKLVMKGNIGHITGRKYYTSGSLFADWINIGAELESGERVTVTIPTHTDGVEIIDDWDGFGQQLSASGTTVLRDAVVYPADVKPKSPRFLYSSAFFQLIHLATLAGISCRASSDAKELLRQKIRVYGGQSIGDLPREDPLLLQVVGRVHSLAYVSCCAVLGAARAVQHAFEEHDVSDRVAYEGILTKCDIEVSQCVTVVTDLVFEATTICFDALGASATKRAANLDRHWRNARTIASHNPRVFHDHAVGDFYVNSKKSPPRTGAGIAKSK